MPKVFLISQPSVSRHQQHQPSLDALYEHGEVRVLVQAGDHPAFNPERTMRLITQRLEDFNFAEDALASAGGDPLAAVMAGIVLADMADAEEQDAFTWLRYDRPIGPDGRRTHEGAKYVPTRVLFYPDESDQHDAAD